MPRLPINISQLSSAFIDGMYLTKDMHTYVHSNAVWIDVTPATVAKIFHIQDCQPIVIGNDLITNKVTINTPVHTM